MTSQAVQGNGGNLNAYFYIKEMNHDKCYTLYF